MRSSTKKKNGFMNKALRGIIFFIGFILILSLAGMLYYQQLIGPVNGKESKSITVEIPRGSSTAKIARILKENHLIRNDLSFRILSKLEKAEGKMQAGKYVLDDGMKAKEIVEALVHGSAIQDSIRFTIPEGFELQQIVERLSSMGLVNKERFMELASNGDFDYKFLEDIPKGKNRLEGFLFPDTYEIAKGANEEEIIVKMLERFDDIFKESYYERVKELNMTLQEAMTLASIIEREAKLEKERAIISSVFHNRLDKGMLLQSCATVQYVLGERKENLSLKDINIDSPYNTYKNIGLPPAPIASPGEASIKAALFPDKTDYFYFVVKSNGEHTFSRTYQEHLKAKNGN